MGIRSLFDITFYSMDNKITSRQDANEIAFIRKQPVDVDNIGIAIYTSMSTFVRGILDGTAIVFR
jgi:hypothetical protein